MLVTGPYLLNGVPLRRVQQCHVIATKTKLDISKVDLPEKLKDKFFKRTVEKRKVKKGQKTVFVPKKKVSGYRRASMTGILEESFGGGGCRITENVIWLPLVPSHHFYLGTLVPSHYSYLGTQVPGHYICT